MKGESMASNMDKFQMDLERLIKWSGLLMYLLGDDLGIVDDETKAKYETEKLKKYDFSEEYEKWYTESHEVVKHIIPDRLDDFQKLYKDEKRKQVDYLTYTLSDYLIGLRTTRAGLTVVDKNAAFPKFTQQVNILEAAKTRFESSLYSIRQMLQADLFDAEIDAARELLKNGFLRGAGAIAGVVLESHLEQVCLSHNVPVRKKNPTISDYNDLLKGKGIIDVPTWRFIQRLGDLRNLCDHKRKSEPKSEEILDLISGVDKISKTVF